MIRKNIFLFHNISYLIASIANQKSQNNLYFCFTIHLHKSESSYCVNQRSTLQRRWIIPSHQRYGRNPQLKAKKKKKKKPTYPGCRPDATPYLRRSLVIACGFWKHHYFPHDLLLDGRAPAATGGGCVPSCHHFDFGDAQVEASVE